MEWIILRAIFLFWVAHKHAGHDELVRLIQIMVAHKYAVPMLHR